MPKELPPETAQRVLDYLLAVEESLHPSQSITIFRRITVADFEALHACKPDKVTDCKFISDELAAVVDGRGIYDHYERAGWVKRQPEPVAEPEEWGPWVKLAKVGERPDGVEFEIGEIVDCCWDMENAHGYKIEAHNPDPVIDSRTWATTTHYRRKRIRCLVKRGHDFVKFIWGAHREHPPQDSAPGRYALRGTLWTPATAPEVTAAKAGRDPNGVVAWHGGKCPVGVGVEGYWHLRRGPAKGPYSLRDGYWDCIPSSGGSEIIAYEVTG
jgi:hypothetical protein